MTGALATGRGGHTMTLLPNGNVLVVGGNGNSAPLYLSSAEIYDSVTEKWRTTGSLSIARTGHTATLLPSGKVLVAGGNTGYTWDLDSAELYDPANGTWKAVGSLKVARSGHSAVLLPNGRLLIAGGSYGSSDFTAEFFDAGLGYADASRPQVAAIASPLKLGGSVVATGAPFRGTAEGSSGNTQDSPTDYPLVQLRHLESGETTLLLSSNWGANTFVSWPLWNFPPGFALVTVFINGIPSTSSIVNINVPVPTLTSLTGAKQVTGRFQFSFTNDAGALFGVLATTNLPEPQTNWTRLGGVVEITPGQFQFSDPQASRSRCYYCLFAP